MGVELAYADVVPFRRYTKQTLIRSRGSTKGKKLQASTTLDIRAKFKYNTVAK